MTPTEPPLLDFPGYPLGDTRPMMRPEGSGRNGVLICGEALGEHEEADQLPFRPYAEAGSVLERALFRAGQPRDNFTLTNLVWYRPPNNHLADSPWEYDAINVCKRFNAALIEKVQPKVILALGGLPYREFTGMSGKKQGILTCRGLITENIEYPHIPVIGSHHPSALRRGSKERQNSGPQGKTAAKGGGTAGMALLGVLIRDIQLAVQVASRGIPKFKPREWVKMGATLSDWQTAHLELLEDPGISIYYDFETHDSMEVDDETDLEISKRTVDQVQICYGETVLVSDWFPELLPVFKAIMELPNPKCDWNGRMFDRPILRDMGVRADLGEWHDLMNLWHHAQPDLPKGLQNATSFVCPEVGPWKHLSGSQAHWYGVLDVDMPKRVHTWLKPYLESMRHPTSNISLWDGYDLQVRRLSPCLDDMTARGMPVNDAKRVALGDTFDLSIDQLDRGMQALVPDHLKNVDPKDGIKRKGTIPKECLEAAGQQNLYTPTTLSHKVVVGDTTYIQREFKDAKSPAGTTWRWAKLLPFTPNGGEQVKRYLKFKGYKIPQDYKTGKDTTSELELTRLIRETHDPLLPLVLQSRELRKAKSTYIDGWKPGPDGRVHPQFGFNPATGQLNSSNPNAQNFPQHAQIAREMRRIVEARPGHTLIKGDYKSFHVLTTGFEAEDPLYMRMSRIDMHSFFAVAGLMRLEAPEKLIDLPDEELAAKLQWYRKSPKTYDQWGGLTFSQIRDEKAKRAILGIGFGQQGRSLFMLNPDSYVSVREAQDCVDAIDRLFPRPAAWRTAVKIEADSRTYLLSRYGYIRRFWDVFQRRPVASNYQPRRGEVVLSAGGREWLCKPGDDAEACIAFRPANDAFGMMRERMTLIHESGNAERYGLILNLHDDLTFECPTPLAEECLHYLRGVMQAPSRVLVNAAAPEGLWCEMEFSTGKNWDGYSADNPEGMRKVKL